MSDALVLPRAKARRRRLPRPPKFTRRQKIHLAIDTTLGVIYLATLLAGVWAPLGCLFGLAAASAGTRRTVLEALDRPYGMIMRAGILATALYAAACVAFIAVPL